MKATVAVIMLASTCFGDALIDRMDLRSPGRVELPARAEVVMPYGSTVTYACYGARIEFDGWLDIVMAVEDVGTGSRHVERAYRLDPVGRGLGDLNFFDLHQHVEGGQRLAFILEESGRSEDFSGSLSLVPHGEGFALGVYGQANPEPGALLPAIAAGWWLGGRRRRPA